MIDGSKIASIPSTRVQLRGCHPTIEIEREHGIMHLYAQRSDEYFIFTSSFVIFLVNPCTELCSVWDALTQLILDPDHYSWIINFRQSMNNV